MTLTGSEEKASFPCNFPHLPVLDDFSAGRCASSDSPVFWGTIAKAMQSPKAPQDQCGCKVLKNKNAYF